MARGGGYFTGSLPAQGYPALTVVETLRLLRMDILERHVPVVRPLMHGIEAQHSERGDSWIDTYITPAGTLWSETCIRHSSTRVTKHLLETRTDLKVMQYIAEHTDYELAEDEFIAEDKLIGDDGLPTVTVHPTPLMELLQGLMSVENVHYALADFGEEMRALFEAMHGRNLREHAAVAASRP
jgi:hypothetical protein